MATPSPDGVTMAEDRVEAEASNSSLRLAA
jgi:hypothetical protein